MKQQTNKTNMKNITIKSVTHCPTCGSECKVNDGTTQYYVPVKKYTEEDMFKLWTKDILYCDEQEIPHEKKLFKDFINSLNKQD